MNQPTINKISKDSYPNLIIEQILSNIKDGTLKPGDLLSSELELSKQFNVGRTSVREALAGLEYMDVIVIDNGKCCINNDVQSFFSKKLLYHVKIDKRQQSDLLDVCRIFLVEFSRLAASRATVNDIKHMRQILKIAEEQLTEWNSAVATTDELLQLLGDSCMEFYSSLVKSTQNTMFERLFGRFKDMIFLLLDDLMTVEYMQQSIECFSRAVRAIENHDCTKAAEAMRNYIALTQTQYRACAEKGAAN